MKAVSARPAIALAFLCVPAVLFPGTAPATVNAPGKGPGLIALGQTLPAARSGQTYLWTLKVEGGTPPYRCVAQKLGLGTLVLTSACKITGIAPVVEIMSVTGPFRFKVADSSSPKKTAEFPNMNFTVVAPQKPAAPPVVLPPAVPSGWKLIKTVHASGQYSDLGQGVYSGDINDPLALAVQIIGNVSSVDVAWDCWVGSSDSSGLKTFTRAGLYTLTVAAGGNPCDVDVVGGTGSGSITVRILAKTGTSSSTTPGTKQFEGSWDGQLTGVLTVTSVVNCYQCGETVGSTVAVTSKVHVTVSQGAMTSFEGYTTGSPSAGMGGAIVTLDQSGVNKPVPASGLVDALVFYAPDFANLPGRVSVSFNSGACGTFSLQFLSNSAASTTISCQGGYESNISRYSFTGSVNLTRTSTTP